MDKYKNIKNKIEREQKVKEEQRKLHKKYKEVDGDIVIKEKGNLIEYVLRTTANIALSILAAIGLLAIIYKEPRMELISVIKETIKQVMGMF